MKIDVSRGCSEPGAELPFSWKMRAYLDKELSVLVDPSPRFQRKYDLEYTICIWMRTKTGIESNEIDGPGVRRKAKNLEFALLLPFDVILRADDSPRCALRFLFDGIRPLNT